MMPNFSAGSSCWRVEPAWLWRQKGKQFLETNLRMRMRELGFDAFEQYYTEISWPVPSGAQGMGHSN